MRHDVLSPIGGELAHKYVEDSSIVAKGAHIADIECMKSMWQVIAPAAGTLHFILQIGDMVGQDEKIAFVEGD